MVDWVAGGDDGVVVAGVRAAGSSRPMAARSIVVWRLGGAVAGVVVALGWLAGVVVPSAAGGAPGAVAGPLARGTRGTAGAAWC
jgi:hypothetical protein